MKDQDRAKIAKAAEDRLAAMFVAAKETYGDGNIPHVQRGTEQWKAWRAWRRKFFLPTSFMEREDDYEVPSEWPPDHKPEDPEPGLEFA